MKKIKLTLDRDTCVSCGSCIAEAFDPVKKEEYFIEDENGNVHINHAKHLDEGKEEIVLEVNDEQYENLQNAVDICPVACIEIIEIKE